MNQNINPNKDFSIDDVPVKDNKGNVRVLKFQSEKISENNIEGNLFKQEFKPKIAKPALPMLKEEKKKVDIAPVSFTEKKDKTKPSSLPNVVPSLKQAVQPNIVKTGEGNNEKFVVFKEPQRILNIHQPALQPPVPAVIKSTKPIFMFHHEDEEEVAKLLENKNKVEAPIVHPLEEKIPSNPLPISGNKGGGHNIKAQGIKDDRLSLDDIIARRQEMDEKIEHQIEDIIKDLDWLDKSESSLNSYGKGESIKNELIKRLKNIIKTRLKGARNNLQTSQALVKNIKQGGVGLSEQEADSVIKVVSNYLETNEIVQEEIPNENAVDKKADMAKIEKKENLNNLEVDKKIEPKKTIFYSPPIKEDKGILAFNKKKKEEKLKDEDEKIKSERVTFYAANRSLPQSGKLKIEDIKYKPRLVGPIEELLNFQVKDFRQLSNNPVKAAEIIKSKIDRLEEDSFSKKLEGIQAWRQSEIYQTYIEIGKQAMAKNKSLRVVVGELKEAGKLYLTEEEFYAIMDLNKRLRF